MPRHVAVIMDGNGRWATRRGLPRAVGHRAGARAVRRVVEAARRRGIATLTLFAFSADNWRRPAAEVEALMGLFERYLAREARRCVENGIRLRVIGRRDRLGRSSRPRDRGRRGAHGGRRGDGAAHRGRLLGARRDSRGGGLLPPGIPPTRRGPPRRARPRRAAAGRPRSTSSFGPAASTGSATSSSGKAPTPRSSSRTGSGPTSRDADLAEALAWFSGRETAVRRPPVEPRPSLPRPSRRLP